jgi:VWFA-related protein
VLVPASVTDEHGRFVSGLSAHDFLLKEDDMPRPIAQFTAQRVPVSVGIVLDASGSMTGDRFIAARFALEQFVATLEPQDEVFLQTFSDYTKVVLPWTSNPAELVTALDRVKPFGATALFRAVTDAYTLLKRGHNVRKALIVLSDGNDNERTAVPPRMGSGFTRDERLSVRRLQTAVGLAQRSDTVLYAVGIGPRRGNAQEAPIDAAKLQQLTDPTGGYTAIVSSSVDIPGAIARIGEDLRSQYLIGFQSGLGADGKAHKIRLTTQDERHRVRARSVFVASR